MNHRYTVHHVNGTTTYTQSTYQDYLSALLDRRSMGRYTLDEAALAIVQSTDEPAGDVLNKLVQAAHNGFLPIYKPGQQTQHKSRIVNALCDEAFSADLNKWLSENEPRIASSFQFPLLATETMLNPTAQATPVIGHKKGADWTDEELQELLKAYRLGRTQEALGQLHNLSQRRISLLLKMASNKFERKPRTSDTRQPFSTLVQFWNNR